MVLYIGDKPVGLIKVVEKEVAKTKFGVSIDNLLGNVDANGTLQDSAVPFVFDGTGIKDFAWRALYYKFYKTKVTEILLSDLVEISGSYACAYAFVDSKNLTSTGLQNLRTISGDSACIYMYQGCDLLTSPGLDNLESITGTNACQTMFYSCVFTRADFPKLVRVDDAGALGKTTSNGIFRNCIKLVEIHFRADAQAVIESLTGYANKFGASNATIYFDL